MMSPILALRYQAEPPNGISKDYISIYKYLWKHPTASVCAVGGVMPVISIRCTETEERNTQLKDVYAHTREGCTSLETCMLGAT